MARIRIIDMMSTATSTPSEGQRPLRYGKNYNISNLAALPADFTADFASVTGVTTGSISMNAKPMSDATMSGIQIICSAKGAGFTSVVVKLQRSNVGGTASGVWEDVPGATVTLTDVGSAFLPELVDATTKTSGLGLKLGQFYRLDIGQTVGGTCVLYGIAYGITDL